MKSKSVLKCYEVLLYCEIDIDNVWLLPLCSYSGGCVEGPREGDQINGQIVAENKIIIQLTSELQDNLPSKVEFWY